MCKMHGGTAPQVQAAAERRMAAAEQAAAAQSLGLVIHTDPIEALQDALNRRRADVLWAAMKISQLGEDQYKQRDMSGKFERPSVWYELYERSLSKYEDIAAKCVGLGIAAQAVDVVRREADTVQALMQSFAGHLGFSWSDERVVSALDAALGELETGEGEAA